ncbi:MAG: pyruvate dehydrogenase E2 component (dihydrolipoamide acetyltransferase) [Gammaproteobacteria bacterium]
MATLTEVTVPDIGDFDAIPVIEVLVAPGDVVTAEMPLITLESDKATMDIPAPVDGVVREIKVAVGDNVAQGTLIVLLDTGTGTTAAKDEDDSSGAAPESWDLGPAPTAAATPAPSAAPTTLDEQTTSSVIEITVPDIGDFDAIPVIEILIKVGDIVQAETPLVTLESDKATMDVPAPQAGTITAVEVAVGDNVSQGSLVARLRIDASAQHATSAQVAPSAQLAAAPPVAAAAAAAPSVAVANDADLSARGESMQKPHSAADPRAPLHRPAPTAGLAGGSATPAHFHATPAIRRFARELGVDLAQVSGSGRKGRVLRDDITAFVKGALNAPSAAPSSGAASTSTMGIEPIPAIDFSRFGQIEEQKLSRIKRISGPFLHRAWLNIPHVTHHDEIDVTDMESFRKSLADEAQRRGVRVTALTFIMKALANTLAAFPSVNSSLSSDGESLILKKYFHIGIAIDTPGGLVVPVFRDVDQKGIFDLAAEMADVSARARDGKLRANDLQGGCMSISSLGGIGGTAFTPIVNAPEVAILGVSRAKMQPVWDGASFVPRLMLPLDLSYDHRVVDGAQAARFVVHLGGLLTDLRRLML